MAHMGLTEAEWQVMECLWMSAPRTGREIIDALGKTTGWSRSTTLTLLRRLEDKGAVSAVCNLFLNTLWISMTGGKAMMVLLPARALKNLGLLPIEALLLYMTAAALTVVLKRAGVQRGVRE